MKLINEKGKLFGIINIVDLLALLLVLFVCFVVAWQIFGDRIAEQAELAAAEREQEELLNSRVKVTYTVRCSTLREPFYDGLLAFGFPQQLAINEGVVADAYIVDAYAEPTIGIVNTDDGQAVTSTYGDREDIILTIEALVLPTEFIKVGSQEIRVGKSHIVKTQFWEISGLVETMELDTQPFVDAGLVDPVYPSVEPKED